MFRELLEKFPVKMPEPSYPVVPVVRLCGVIGGSTVRSRKPLTIAAYSDAIEAAFRARGAKAVALVINSPGGSPVQSDLIARRILALSEEKNLPVYAFVEDVAASGGYWLACAADEIHANAMSIVGSIGVISSGFGFVDLIEKIGVERRVHTHGTKKSMLDPFEPEREADIKRLKAIQKDVHDQFIAYVKARRGDRLKGTDTALFSGEFWTALSARNKGLVDGIGDLRTVMREKLGDNVRFRNFTPSESWLARRFGTPIARLGGSGLAEELVDVASERLLWNRYGL